MENTYIQTGASMHLYYTIIIKSCSQSYAFSIITVMLQEHSVS